MLGGDDYAPIPTCDERTNNHVTEIDYLMCKQ
jgi:hypothetical protein